MFILASCFLWLGVAVLMTRAPEAERERMADAAPGVLLALVGWLIGVAAVVLR